MEELPEELSDWEAPELEFSLPATLLNPWGTDFENETAKLENITQIRKSDLWTSAYYNH